MTHTARAPYSVTPIPFRFAALAGLAGTLPLGQGRESAIAVLLVARLAAAALAGNTLPAAVARRAEAARGWLPPLCPDRGVRAAGIGVCDAVMGGEPHLIAKSVARVMEVTAPILTPAARSELSALAQWTDR